MTRSSETRAVRQASLGWMINVLARRLDGQMNRQLAPHGLSIQSFAVMMTVLEHAPLSAAEIGDNLSMPPYAISRALDVLEAAGYVERRPHPTSRRAQHIHVTMVGDTLAPSLYEIVREVNAVLVADLSEADRKVLLRLLSGLVLGAGAHHADAADAR